MFADKTRILAHSRKRFSGALRHPGIAAGIAAIGLFGTMAAFALARQPATPSFQTVVEGLAITPTTAVQDDDTFLIETVVQRGDTVSSLLQRAGIEDQDFHRAARSDEAMREIHRQLRPGQVVSSRIAYSGRPEFVAFPVTGEEAAVVIRSKIKGVEARKTAYQLSRHTVLKSGVIKHSLFGATDAAGVPDNIAIQMAEIFGGDIDFHRDLRKGDRFSVVYEVALHEGRAVQSGRILAAEFSNNDHVFRAVWYDRGEHRGYYDDKGKSTKKAFLRSPLEFSRISSGFKMRFHPVLKKWRAHKGVDYAAPTGTRVKTTANGTVEFSGRQNGYGNIVIIRHNATHSTAYAHLSRMEAGIRKGKRVMQGDVIGRVGSTGWATGPHLHYEFRVNGKQVNPLTIALPPALPLDNKELPRFHAYASPLVSQLGMLANSNLGALE